MAYLVVSGRLYSREALTTFFWPDNDSASARTNLRRDLSRLNKLLGPDRLAIDREQVGLADRAELWLDVAHFRRCLATSKTCGHSDQEVCPSCLPMLSEAATLYTADFLAGFTITGSPAFDEWQFFETESLRHDLAGALKRLACAHAAEGNLEVAIPYARRWLTLDPLHEPAHRQLMRLYAQSGQPAAAQRQYRLCVETLKAELGVTPATETLELYEHIRSGDLSRGDREPGSKNNISPPVSLPDPSIPPALHHNLPVQTMPFVGRETELAQLAQLLTAPGIRLVTILGSGGMGKTRLALELAATQLERFEHGVYFVRLGPLESPEGIVPAIAEALHFSFYDGSSPEQQLYNYLRQKQMLLVMDNYEHLLDPSLSPLPEGRKGGAEVVVDLLKAASGLKILTTSRVKLNIREEQNFPIRGIDFPDEVLGEEADQFSAVKLFLESARRVRPDFALTARDMVSVARICRLVQGMPLGLILAATWVELLSPAEIADELAHNLDFLETEMSDLPQRQQSMRAVFDHSWRLLSEQERKLFQQLSVFRGGFTREAVQAITRASLPTLRALVHKSFLQRAPTGRYEIHELLRQYAVEKLSQLPGDSETACDRHSAYYCTFLQEQEADLKGARQHLALATLQVEHDNIRLAWNWAAEQGQVERLAWSMDGLGLFCDWRGHYSEGKIAFQMTAKRLTPSSETLPLLARLSAWQALFCQRMGQTEQAHQLFQKSLSCLNSPELTGRDIHSEEAFVLFEMGNFMIRIDPQVAKQLLEQSLKLSQVLGDRWATARALTSLGDNARNLSKHEEAQQWLQASLALQQELGDHKGAAKILLLLGHVARHQGQLEEAEQLQRQSLRLIEKIGDRAGLAEVYMNLGASLVWLGRFSDGIRHFEKSLAIYRDLGHHDGLAESNDYLAEAKQHLGWYDQTSAHDQMALRRYQDASNQRGLGYSFMGLGQIALVKEAYPEAQQWLQEGVVLLRQVKQQVALGFALAMLGGLACHTHHFQQAQEYFVEPLQIALKTRAFFLLHVTSAFIALFLASQGQPERAVEIYTLASCFPYIANSRWFEDVAGRHVAGTLPPEVVAAARERGKARDLWVTAAELLAELERTN
jgi:predicted ATPase/DNA-binding SARP family transcriptional activator